MKLYVFIYFLSSDIEKTKTFLGKHVKYWKNLKLEYFKNGPFADRSGGLIIFSAWNDEKAAEIVGQDPLLQGDTLEKYWLKEWVA